MGSFARGVCYSYYLRIGDDGDRVTFLAKEHKAVYSRMSESLGGVVSHEERQRTLTGQQLSWQNKSSGRWIVAHQQFRSVTESNAW